MVPVAPHFPPRKRRSPLPTSARCLVTSRSVHRSRKTPDPEKQKTSCQRERTKSPAICMQFSERHILHKKTKREICINQQFSTLTRLSLLVKQQNGRTDQQVLYLSKANISVADRYQFFLHSKNDRCHRKNCILGHI